MRQKGYTACPCRSFLRQRRSSDNDDDDDDELRRGYKRGGAGDCCCCSNAVIGALLVASLICIAGIVPALTIVLTKSAQSTSTSTDDTSTNTPLTSNATSNGSTTLSASTVNTTASSLSSSSSSASASSATTSIVGSTLISTTTSTSTTTSVTTSTTTTTTTTTAPYCLQRATFDDIPGQLTTGVVPNGYYNLNWTNVQYVNASSMPLSGYQTGVNSSPFVAYNLGGNTVQISTGNGTRFAFNSIILAAAWRDGLTWTITGKRAGAILITAPFSLYVMNQTIISCGSCPAWDTIVMTSSGGTPYLGLSKNTTEFVFDDLCISFGY